MADVEQGTGVLSIRELLTDAAFAESPLWWSNLPIVGRARGRWVFSDVALPGSGLAGSLPRQRARRTLDASGVINVQLPAGMDGVERHNKSSINTIAEGPHLDQWKEFALKSTNQALNYDHTKSIEAVTQSLYRGEGAYDLGLYDKAEEHFHDVLRVDPYNKAARRWLERCATIKADYFRAAYDENRARMLMQVDRAWELALPPVGFEDPGGAFEFEENSGKTSIASKLQQIIVPVIDFQDTTVQEAVDFLRIRSKELDIKAADLERKSAEFDQRLLFDVAKEDAKEEMAAEKIDSQEDIALLRAEVNRERINQGTAGRGN